MQNKIYSLIPKVMSDIGAVGKDQLNKHQNYKFRGIDDMYNAIQPALVKNGIFCVPVVLKTERRDRKFSNGTAGLETFVEVEYKFYADDGSYIKSIVTGEAMDSGDKSNNKALSSAFKYCLMELFCIPTTEPKDSENDTYLVAPTAEEVMSGERKPLVYTVPFGKFKDKKIEDIDPIDLVGYIKYIREKAKKQNQSIDGNVKEFLDEAEGFLSMKAMDDEYNQTIKN